MDVHTFLAQHGWGIQGKLGISKLLQPSDVESLKTMKAVVAYRPRGVLSGFLAILPRQAIFVPPGKAPQQVRMRLQEDVWREGAILSAYLDGTDIVLEDVLMWRGKSVWDVGFEERSRRMQEFVDAWKPDDVLQGCGIRLAQYFTLGDLEEPEERQVLEFVPLAPRTKRMVWIPTEEVKGTTWIAKREKHVGPDVFSLWSLAGEKQPTLALVRTLAISRTLHCHPVDEFKVQSEWNKRFGRWEILGIA